jgi:hypothetical protein
VGNNTAIGLSDNPPDVQLAAGPSHIVEMVNSVVGIYSKPFGGLQKITAINTFFKASATDFVFDPKVLFDNSSQRWFASIGDCPNFPINTQCQTGVVKIAVSNSTDPTQSWKVYTVAPSSGWSDQPILGISDNLVVISANDFPNLASGYNGAQYWVFNKSDMVAGVSNVRNQTFGPDLSLFSVHPVQSLSPTTTQSMVTAVNAGSLNTTGGPANRVELFSMTGTPPNVSVTTTMFTVSTISQAPYGSEPLAGGVNPDDARVTTAAWRNGKLWLGLDDKCTPIADNQTRSCIRLDEIDTGSLSLLQDFDFGTKGVYQYYPALSMDSSGNLGLIFGYSNSTTYPSLGLTGQLTTDPVNSAAKTLTLRTGSAPEATSRYGDYFGAAVDPSDPTVMWMAGEYHHSVHFIGKNSCPNTPDLCYWDTAIGALTLFQPDFSLSAPSTINCPHSGKCDYKLTATSLHAFSGSIPLTVTAAPSGSTITMTPSYGIYLNPEGSWSSTTISVSTPVAGTVTITGTSGSLAHSLSTSIVIK